MKDYNGLKVTNFQSLCINFILGVSIVHTGVYLMTLLHQVGIVNSTHILLPLFSIALAAIIAIKKRVQSLHVSQ